MTRKYNKMMFQHHFSVFWDHLGSFGTISREKDFEFENCRPSPLLYLDIHKMKNDAHLNLWHHILKHIPMSLLKNMVKKIFFRETFYDIFEHFKGCPIS